MRFYHANEVAHDPGAEGWVFRASRRDVSFQVDTAIPGRFRTPLALALATVCRVPPRLGYTPAWLTVLEAARVAWENHGAFSDVENTANPS